MNHIYYVCPGCKKLERCPAFANPLTLGRMLCQHADGINFQMIACRDRREATMYLARA